MPRGNGGRPFPPGVSGNPRGSSAKAQALARVRKLTGEQLASITEDILLGDRFVLQSVEDNPDATFLQLWTVRLLRQSMENGDIAAYRAILDRVCGKPKETVSLGGDANGEPLRFDTRTREEKLERLAVLQAARRRTESNEHPPIGSEAAGEE